MKNFIIALLFSIGLLTPINLGATTSLEMITQSTKPKVKKKKKGKKSSKKSKTRKSFYSSANNCSYNGHELNVGPRGGCYYYSGSSKQYVDRSYCSGCR